MAEPGFWDRPDKAREAIQEANRLKQWVEPWEELSGKAVELKELADLLQDDPDPGLEEDWGSEARGVGKRAGRA